MTVDAPPTDKRHALYRFFDADGALLYVGITKTPSSRFTQHAGDKVWWELVATITIETHPSREAVLAAESTAIRSERPKHNVMHNRDVTRSAACVVSSKAPSSTAAAAAELVGDWVAIDTEQRECPYVGVVVANSEDFIKVQLVSALTGMLDDDCVGVRWVDVNGYRHVRSDPDGVTDIHSLWVYQTNIANRNRWFAASLLAEQVEV